jgi:hypothetical protein
VLASGGADPGTMRRAATAGAGKVDELVARVDRPWVWPLGEAIGGGVLVSIALSPDSWWWRGALLAAGVMLLGFSAWANSRRGVRLKTISDERDQVRRERDSLAAEASVAQETLDKTRVALDDVVERMVFRQYQGGGLTSEDRITWLYLGADHLRVVGRHCHDPVYKSINTVRYPADFGLMGRALASRKVESRSYTDPSLEYEKWQKQSCRISRLSDVSQLTMRSKEYRVVPLTDHAGAAMLGVVVLESLEAGTPRLDALAADLKQHDTRRPIIDVLEVLAQAPDPGTEEAGAN